MIKMRILEDDNRMLHVQELKFGLIWWTVFKTYNAKGALAIASVGREYNETTGYWE